MTTVYRVRAPAASAAPGDQALAYQCPFTNLTTIVTLF
jgi:hypothetical protein